MARIVRDLAQSDGFVARTVTVNYADDFKGSAAIRVMTTSSKQLAEWVGPAIELLSGQRTEWLPYKGNTLPHGHLDLFWGIAVAMTVEQVLRNAFSNLALPPVTYR